MPVNVLDQIETRLSKVGRYLKREFGSVDKMEAALRGAATVPDKNENISVDDLKSFVVKACKD